MTIEDIREKIQYRKTESGKSIPNIANENLKTLQKAGEFSKARMLYLEEMNPGEFQRLMQYNNLQEYMEKVEETAAMMMIQFEDEWMVKQPMPATADPLQRTRYYNEIRAAVKEQVMKEYIRQSNSVQ
ncbi:TnpV protein [Listeria booriae]|uniref:TnpV protein n=1 Tax=Listeria booriae TaxID=1552123 RepID=UPI0039B6ECC9|nr:TnpV protein [Listeria booriae]